MRDYPAAFEIWGNCIIRRHSPEGPLGLSILSLCLLLAGFCNIGLVIVANGGFDGTTWSRISSMAIQARSTPLQDNWREKGFRDRQGVYQ